MKGGGGRRVESWVTLNLQVNHHLSFLSEKRHTHVCNVSKVLEGCSYSTCLAPLYKILCGCYLL